MVRHSETARWRGIPEATRRDRLHRALALGVVVAVALGAAGCDGPRRAALPSPVAALTTPADSPPPRVAMAPVPLMAQGDFDALEDSLLDRRPLEELAAVYAALSEGADPASRREDALLLQRHAILLAGGRGGRDWIAQATRLGDALNRAAPDDPHTLYLNGWLKRIILQSDAGGRGMIVADFNLIAAEQVLDDWGRLLAVAPDYDGPRDHDGPAIAEDLAQLRAGLAAYRAGAPGDDAEASPPLARVGSSRDLIDHEQLTAFEGMGLAARRGLCRDRHDQLLTGGTSPAGARLDLACALLEADGRGGPTPEADPEGRIARALASGALEAEAARRLPVGALDRALDAIARLVAAASFDACRVRADVLGRVTADTPERAWVLETLDDLGVPACP